MVAYRFQYIKKAEKVIFRLYVGIVENIDANNFTYLHCMIKQHSVISAR